MTSEVVCHTTLPFRTPSQSPKGPFRTSRSRTSSVTEKPLRVPNARTPSEVTGEPFRTATARTQYNVEPFSFEGRISFDAHQDLSKTRSSNFHIRHPPKDDDIWKIPPPDFRPQNFAPKPLKRNSREAMKPWKYGTLPVINHGSKKERKMFVPHVLQLENCKTRKRSPKEEQRADFVTKFDRPRCLSSRITKLQRVKSPKEEQSPDFVTKFDRPRCLSSRITKLKSDNCKVTTKEGQPQDFVTRFDRPRCLSSRITKLQSENNKIITKLQWENCTRSPKAEQPPDFVTRFDRPRCLSSRITKLDG